MEGVYMYKKIKGDEKLEKIIRQLSDEEINQLMHVTWDQLTEQKKIEFLEEVME